MSYWRCARRPRVVLPKARGLIPKCAPKSLHAKQPRRVKGERRQRKEAVYPMGRLLVEPGLDKTCAWVSRHGPPSPQSAIGNSGEHAARASRSQATTQEM